MWAARRWETKVSQGLKDNVQRFFFLRTMLKLLTCEGMRKENIVLFFIKYVDSKVPARFLVGRYTGKSALKRTNLQK